MEATTGEPNSETAINGDMRILTEIEAPKEAIETATEEIISELNEGGFMRELIGAVREYENAVSSEPMKPWLWGWKEYRLDLPGQRYAVGHDGLNWLLVDDGNQLRLWNGEEECSADKAH